MCAMQILVFNKEAVFVVPAYSDSALMARMKPLKLEILKDPDVIDVSLASDVPSSDNNWASNFYFDNSGKDIDFPSFLKYADEDYFKTYGLHFLAGQGFSARDTMHELVVNETMMRKLGITDPHKMLGKTIKIGSGHWLPIVGVVKDFKTNSLREDIKPLTISSLQRNYNTVGIKMLTGNIAHTTAQVQKLWQNTYPEYAYESHFMDESIERFYRQENQLSLLYKIFAGIAIFISCLGLYGLVSYMGRSKNKRSRYQKSIGRHNRQYCSDVFKRIYTAYYDSVCNCSAGCLVRYERLVAKFCLPHPYGYWHFCIGNFCFADNCMDNGWLPCGKSGAGKSGEEFEKRVTSPPAPLQLCWRGVAKLQLFIHIGGCGFQFIKIVFETLVRFF